MRKTPRHGPSTGESPSVSRQHGEGSPILIEAVKHINSLISFIALDEMEVGDAEWESLQRATDFVARIDTFLAQPNADSIPDAPPGYRHELVKIGEEQSEQRDAARYRWLRALAYRTSDMEPPHWCIPETCGLGADIDAAIDAAMRPSALDQR